MDTLDTSVSTPADSSVAGLFTCFRAILIKQFTILFRYRINLLAQIISIYLFFVLVFFGGRAAIGSVGSSGSLESTFDSVIVGWFLWTMAQGAYSGLPRDVTNESQWGTLEQLYMSPYGFGTVMTCKTVVNMVKSMVIGMVILGMMILTTQRTLTIGFVTITVISALALLSIIGVGFVFAGLAMVYKRVGNVTSLVQFAIIGLISSPSTGYEFVRLLPLAQGSDMLQRAMLHNMSLWEFSLQDIGILSGTAFVYATGGYVVFQYCSQVARERGVMGHY